MPTLPSWPLISRSPYTGLVPTDYNPVDVSLETLEQMRRRDPIVRYAYRHLTRSIRRRLGDYTHDDERIAEWVQSNILPATIRDLGRVQKAIYYGCALAQPRYVLDGGQLRLAELVGCPQSRFWHSRGFRRDAQGNIDAVDIQDLGYVELVDADTGARQLIHYATGDDDGGPWGEPSARLAYTAWFIKHRLSGFEAIGLEKHGTGTAVFSVEDDAQPVEGDLAPSEQYVADWSAMGSNSAIAISKDDTLEVVQPGWGAGSPFDAVIHRLDGYIFNSFFMPHLIAAESQFGTRAQASVSLETYLMAETDLAEELADQVVLDQVIAPAIALQWGPGHGRGDITIRDPAPPDLESWARIFQTLDSIGAFNAEVDEQLAYLGERFGLPVDELSQLLASGVTRQSEPPA